MKSAHLITGRDASLHPPFLTTGIACRGFASPNRIEVGVGSRDLPPMDDLVRLAALGKITAEVTHDLGNLLQVIASGLHLIDRNLRQATDVDLRPFCESALAAIERAGQLRLQILEQARANALNDKVDLGAVLSDLRGLIDLTAGPGIRVVLSAPTGVVRLNCDARGLENVVLNLVANARDAMPHGGLLTIEMSLSLPWPGASGESCAAAIGVLKVTDTGCGMTQEILAEATKPFFTTKALGSGTGLGLPMVCDFVRRCGGSAEIASIVGEGTSVTLRLPACWY